jgi:hypothetical protein
VQQNRETLGSLSNFASENSMFDWNALGAVAELVGAIAVVMSLVYLASQIRSGSRALETTMRDSSFHALTEWNYSILADPDLAWIFQEGSRSPESLDEKERARFSHIAYSFLKLFENLYLHQLDGSISSETWEYNRHVLVLFAVQPGFRAYVVRRRAIFNPRFLTMIDALEGTEMVNTAELWPRPAAS